MYAGKSVKRLGKTLLDSRVAALAGDEKTLALTCIISAAKEYLYAMEEGDNKRAKKAAQAMGHYGAILDWKCSILRPSIAELLDTKAAEEYLRKKRGERLPRERAEKE